MSGVATVLEAALGPVRDALLDAAEADVRDIDDAARRDAGAVVGAAKDRAAAILRDARAEGEDEAAAAVAARLADARRAARAVVLAAQSDLYEELTNQAVSAAVALRDSPGYAPLRDALAGRARVALGPDAVIEEGSDGGVVATEGSRRLDLSLSALALRELDQLGPEVSRLWTS